MKIRIKFEKLGLMKFIGHLDTMRCFQKAMRRAGIEIAYSEGFSPHQIMSFAAPLGVGLTSKGEYLDIEVRTAPLGGELLDSLNQVMADGIRILSVKKLPEGAKNAMACVDAASYLACGKDGLFLPSAGDPQKAEAFLEQKQISILKKTKRSETLTDIRPMIYEFEPVSTACGCGEEPALLSFRLLVAQGSAANLKPEPVLKAFFEFCALPWPERGFSCMRLDLYQRVDGGLIPLSREGEDF